MGIPNVSSGLIYSFEWPQLDKSILEDTGPEMEWRQFSSGGQRHNSVGSADVRALSWIPKWAFSATLRGVASPGPGTFPGPNLVRGGGLIFHPSLWLLSLTTKGLGGEQAPHSYRH